jgi:surfactin family lipopeptide synthetase A
VKEVGAPPIGRPIGNTRLYILDQSMQPVPIGVVGELHVAGVSLAREYLHRPEMTSQKFIMDPFNEKAGERLYKTGDLARYRPDGNIEFLGRVDSQVKIRGFRIELGEIENALEFHSGVHEAVVIAREDSPGDRRLVAYIVPKDSLTEIESGENNPSALLIEKPVMNVRELRSHLNQTLPEYMIPSQFVFLKGLPISPSGKVDRRALPAPELERSFLEREFVAPRSEIEIKLAKISCDLLGIQQVGIYDNFFDLGGHSLLATQFISRVREELNVELPLRSLFENPTIAGLSETVEKVQKIQTPDRAKILEMLARIEELSDEEVNILLEQKIALLAKGKLND